MTLAETHGFATEILAEESFQTESTGSEGTTNTESHKPEETNKNKVERLELRLTGGIVTDSEGKQQLESAISEPIETNHLKNTKSRGLEKPGITASTTLELPNSYDTFDPKFIANGKSTDLPIKITHPIKVQLRENSEYVASHELDGTTNSELTEITRNGDLNESLELKRRMNSTSKESLEPIGLSRINTGMNESVKSERATKGDLNEPFESERLTSLVPDESIPSRNGSEELHESLKPESDVSTELGKSPEVQTTVKSDLYKPLELDSWMNNELEALNTKANGEKYEPATSTTVFNGVQHALNKGMKAQHKNLLSKEALTKGVASETGFRMRQGEGSTIHSTLTSQVTPAAVRTLLASYDKNEVQQKHMHSNQSLSRTKG